MTVSAGVRSVAYTGNGASKTFPVPYQFFEITVSIDNIVKTNGVDYTITGGGGNPGSITFGVAPASGTTIIIDGSEVIAQAIDLSDEDPFPADTIEKALDRLTMISGNLETKFSTTVEAAQSAFQAAQSASSALASGDAAAASATAAAASATASATSASAAATSKTGADTAATNAATSATNAATSKTGADTAATNASNSATAANTSKNNAATSETNAAASATAAANSATAANTSKGNAATSETNAAASATAAANSATAANTSKNAAATSATAAANSAAAASAPFKNLKADFGAVGNGSTDDTTAFTNAITYCLANKRTLFVPAGTYRIVGNVTIDLSSYLSQGFYMFGEGRNISSIVFDAGYTFAIEASADWHFGFIKQLRISGNVNGTFMRVGKTNYSDPANEFILDDLFIANGSTGGSAIALQLNYFCNGYVNAVINGGGYNVGTKVGSGFAALDIRQAVFSTFLGSYSLSGTGAYLRDGFVYGNTFLNVDTEACTTDWVISSANAINNTWVGGQISLATTGVQASAGSNNVFINPHVDVASLTGVFNGTTGVWFKTPGYSNVASPTFPSTGVSVTNNKGQSVVVYLNGGTITGVAINGTTVFNQAPPITFILQPGDTTTITYTGTPAWVWLPLF